MTERKQRSRRERIVVMSRLMAMACVAVAFLLPLAVVGSWLLASPGTLAGSGRIMADAAAAMSVGDRLIAAAVTLLSVLPLTWAFMRLRVCFAGFAAGRLFEQGTIAGFREFGLGILASALLSVPVNAAISVLASRGTQVAVAFGSDTLLMLCISGTVAVVGWVLGEASVIAQENESFV